MAESNITKNALARALRELMEEIPFEKINVAQICDKCNMNRKSFYYHFQDKYDLINWIFDTELLALAQATDHITDYEGRWGVVGQVCSFLYENRKFYGKAILMKGQNSLSEHLRNQILPRVQERIEMLVGNVTSDDFVVHFFVDATLGAVARWLTAKDPDTPEEFVGKLRLLIESSATAIHQQLMR